jgi:hypothetical protein
VTVAAAHFKIEFQLILQNDYCKNQEILTAEAKQLLGKTRFKKEPNQESNTVEAAILKIVNRLL